MRHCPWAVLVTVLASSDHVSAVYRSVGCDAPPCSQTAVANAANAPMGNAADRQAVSDWENALISAGLPVPAAARAGVKSAGQAGPAVGPWQTSPRPGKGGGAHESPQPMDKHMGKMTGAEGPWAAADALPGVDADEEMASPPPPPPTCDSWCNEYTVRPRALRTAAHLSRLANNETCAMPFPCRSSAADGCAKLRTWHGGRAAVAASPTPASPPASARALHWQSRELETSAKHACTEAVPSL